MQALCAKEKDVHIQLDKITAVTFLNNMFKPFVLWHADPDAYATDAMCLSWKTKYAYIFPPFSILFRILQKLQEDQARAIVIAPLWRTGTTKQYRVYLDKWTNFARARNESFIHPTVAKVLELLTHLYDGGGSYSAINTARSALSAAVDLSDNLIQWVNTH